MGGLGDVVDSWERRLEQEERLCGSCSLPGGVVDHGELDMRAEEGKFDENLLKDATCQYS